MSDNPKAHTVQPLALLSEQKPLMSLTPLTPWHRRGHHGWVPPLPATATAQRGLPDPKERNRALQQSQLQLGKPKSFQMDAW